MKTILLFAILAIVTASGGHAADEVGTLKGSVKYDGDPPARKRIDASDRLGVPLPVKEVLDDSLVVDPKTKGIQWVIVRIMNATPKDAPPKAATVPTLDQKGYHYTPHVLIVAPKTDFEILNPDKILNNFHTTPYHSENPQANFVIEHDREKTVYKGEWLASPDLIEFRSDIYSWMKGFILCHDPRYCAVTGADGTFEIKALPVGKYKLEIWHEKLGRYLRKLIDVEIKPGAATDLGELKFAPTK